MKLKKLLFLAIAVGLISVSCQQEEIDITTPTTEQAATKD
jgi:hypothetical protein